MSVNKWTKEEFAMMLKKLQRGNLTVPDHNPTIQELVAEGLQLLAEEEKLKPKQTTTATTKLPTLPTTKSFASSENPYLRARAEVLKKMSAFERNEIGRMEQTGDINNKRYEEFCHQVRVYADSKFPF